jgi:hypothetical protein
MAMELQQEITKLHLPLFIEIWVVLVKWIMYKQLIKVLGFSLSVQKHF